MRLEPDDALEKRLEKDRQIVLEESGIGRFLKTLQDHGCDEDEIYVDVVRFLEDDYREGRIKSLEEMDKRLWPFCFELNEESFMGSSSIINFEEAYQDEPRPIEGQAYPTI